ncbi:YbaB/EbfC family nucleoid-associated protein [Mycobacterium marinum]|uniref:YbaB/EbfC family nucleoid-associated protein n=1 Tax=Mycobacterium marinum TaxID=1781 RepID=UPI000B9728CF|nr:YbaB/EbfC family nucleoid-associated protein [Mycobacterium marinum]MDC8993362.1 YbaB/EbfC family nucleoid-associated protein [Mycobacterium marinum]MDC9014153.1 YbaB/EbfC family nucleoid-associated protein [Mycobacterium marinum]WDZ15230.1 YbaB/EbfC family nucleoid-associated protein [Mycobacterium marinum]
MSTQMHPQVAEALRQAQQFQSAFEDQLHRTNSGSFAGTDEAKTVDVTLNGRQWLTDLHIEEGLLRLGAEAVEQRINEALQDADAVASAGIEARQQQFLESLAGISSELQKGLGIT